MLLSLRIAFASSMDTVLMRPSQRPLSLISKLMRYCCKLVTIDVTPVNIAVDKMIPMIVTNVRSLFLYNV